MIKASMRPDKLTGKGRAMNSDSESGDFAGRIAGVIRLTGLFCLEYDEK